ncbi:MAG: hypothetical protein AAF399_24815 [Bacteroidota bacterium]
MRRIPLFLVSCLLIFSNASLLGQNQATPPPLQLGLGWWGYNYLGDLSEEQRWGDRAYPGIRLSLQFDGKKALQFQFNVGYGRIVDQTDAPPIVQQDAISNTYVETPFFFTDVRIRWFFLRFHRIESFVSAGGNLLFFRPLDQFGNFLGENYFSRLPEEQYNTNVFAPPVGLGVQIRINPVLKIGIEYNHFFTLTDYLDNIGELGGRAGNDRLQGLGVNMMLNLNTVSPTPLEPLAPEPAPIPEAPPLAWSWEQEAMLLSHWEITPSGSDAADRMVLTRVQDPLMYAMIQEVASNHQAGKWPSEFPLPSLEIPLTQPAPIAELANLFQLPLSELKALNPKAKELIPAGSLVSVPNAFLID